MVEQPSRSDFPGELLEDCGCKICDFRGFGCCSESGSGEVGRHWDEDCFCSDRGIQRTKHSPKPKKCSYQSYMLGFKFLPRPKQTGVLVETKVFVEEERG